MSVKEHHRDCKQCGSEGGGKERVGGGGQMNWRFTPFLNSNNTSITNLAIDLINSIPNSCFPSGGGGNEEASRIDRIQSNGRAGNEAE